MLWLAVSVSSSEASDPSSPPWLLEGESDSRLTFWFVLGGSVGSALSAVLVPSSW